MSTTIIRRPRAQGTDNNWSVFGGFTKWQTLDDDPATDGSGASPNLGTSAETYLFVALGIDPQSVISGVKLRSRDNGSTLDTIALRCRFGGNILASPTFGMTGSFPTMQETEYVFPRPGGGVWTPADVDAAEFGWDFHNWSVHATPGGMELYLIVTYDVAGVQLEQVRDVASRLCARYGAQPDRIAIPVAAALLGLRPGQIVSVAHKLLPTAEGEGRGSEQWQRLVGRIYERELDLDNIAAGVTVRFEDLRDVLKRYWDGGISPKEPGGLKDGVLILSPGGLRTYDGPPTVVESPVSGLLVQVAEDTEPVGAHGRLFEGEATNQIVNSAFIDQLNGWTQTGTPSPDSVTEQFFDPSVTLYHCKLGTLASSISQASLTAEAGWNWISLPHREVDPSDLTRVRVQRASDSQYLNQSLAWQAGATDIDLPYRATNFRDAIGPIDQTAGATTYTVTVKTTVAGDESHVGHVQVEAAQHGKGWPSSPIVTGASPVTRAANSLVRNNDSANRLIPANRFCYRGRVRLLWDSANVLAGEDMYVMNVEHDANNWIRLYYDVSASAWVFEFRHGGVTHSVSFPAAVVPDTEYAFAVSKQGTGGENGDPNHTISITIGAQTRVTATAGTLTENSDSDWNVGSFDGTTGHLNGYLFDEQVLDFVPTLSENRKWART